MLHWLVAIDRKRIALKKTAHSDSLWHNCKGYFSMVLLAVCDAHYNITGIDIGKYRSNNYYGVLLKSEQNCLNMLPPKTLDGLDETVPFFLVGDEILHPFTGKQLTDFQILK